MESNRINSLFADKKEDILSVYFCAGYPSADNTAEVIKALQNGGVDMVEIGIPFSDPIADGKVIQNAATAALRNGMSLSMLFSQLKDIRRDVGIPLVLMGYLNPVMQYGFEEFFASCAKCGIDGCIIPDLPFDEYVSEIKPLAESYGVKIIMLITPETDDDRVREIDANTEGFIYMVSSASTTGARETFDEEALSYFRRINAMPLGNPRMIGFGIGNRATFEASCRNASGAIIGSRFVTLLGESESPEAAVKELKRILSE